MIPDRSESDLSWISIFRPRWSYELRAHGQVLATFDCSDAVRAHAHDIVTNRHYLFHRSGVVQETVEVHTTERDAKVALFRRGWLEQGIVVLASGCTARWRCFGFLDLQWAFVADSGERLISFVPTPPGAYGHSMGAEVVAADLAPGRLDDLTVLILLGWYLIISGVQDWYRLPLPILM